MRVQTIFRRQVSSSEKEAALLGEGISTQETALKALRLLGFKGEMEEAQQLFSFHLGLVWMAVARNVFSHDRSAVVLAWHWHGTREVGSGDSAVAGSLPCLV